MKKRELNPEDVNLIDAENSVNESEDTTASDFIQKNSKLIIGISVLIIIVIGVSLFLKNKAEKDSMRASQLLTRVAQYYETGDYEKALNGDPSKTYMGEQVKGLKYIADEFGSTDAGKISALYAANSFLNTNKKNEAAKYFEIAEGSDADIIKLGAVAGLAAVSELNNKLKEAAEYYLEAAGLTDEDNIKARYLFYAGLSFEKSGDKSKAEAQFREVLKLSEFGEFSPQAKAGLSRIGTKIE